MNNALPETNDILVIPIRNSTTGGPRPTPVDPAVAARVAANFGVYAQRVVLSTESPDLFRLMVADLHRMWRPGSNYENLLVQDIADCRWRLMRILDLANDCDDPASERAVILSRHEFRLRRYIAAAEKSLRQAQADRGKRANFQNEPPAPAPGAEKPQNGPAVVEITRSPRVPEPVAKPKFRPSGGPKWRKGRR